MMAAKMRTADPKQRVAAMTSALDFDLTRFDDVSHCSILSTQGVIMRAHSILGILVTWLPAHTRVSSMAQCRAAASTPAPFSKGDTLRLPIKRKQGSDKEHGMSETLDRVARAALASQHAT